MISNFFCKLIVEIGFKPSAHGEPFGSLIPVPAILVSQNHPNNVIAKAAEGREKFRKHKKVGDRVGKTFLGNILRLR